MRKKIFVGLDPDIRLINCAIIDDQKNLLAILLRRNKEPAGIQAVVGAAYQAARLAEDVLAYAVAHEGLDGYETVMVVEGQSMMHTKKKRESGKKINYDSILQVGQVTGMLLAAFNNIAHQQHLVLPSNWKGTLPKGIHHPRIYNEIGLESYMMGSETDMTKAYAVPLCYSEPVGLQAEALTKFSYDQVNPGDFRDISDSVGLALFGIKKGF